MLFIVYVSCNCPNTRDESLRQFTCKYCSVESLKKIMTWNETKENYNKLIREIEEVLKTKNLKSINDIFEAINEVDKDMLVIPNPNSKGKYCQLILYPSKKWNTWSKVTMSISQYNLYN